MNGGKYMRKMTAIKQSKPKKKNSVWRLTAVFPQTEPNSSTLLKCREPIFRKFMRTLMHWNSLMFTPIPQAAPRLYTDRDFSV